MTIWTLVKTIATESMHAIGNLDAVYTFRIEIYRSGSAETYKAKAWRYVYCDLHVSSERYSGNHEYSTEELICCEDSLGIEEMIANTQEGIEMIVINTIRRFYVPLASAIDPEGKT